MATMLFHRVQDTIGVGSETLLKEFVRMYGTDAFGHMRFRKIAEIECDY
jgi:hypothetical protein